MGLEGYARPMLELTDVPTIDAEAFPLHVLVPHQNTLLLLQPVARDAVPELDETYADAALDVHGGPVDIDAHWRVPKEANCVYLLLQGRNPRRFDLAVRFSVAEQRERDFFLELGQRSGPVGLLIYPDKEMVVRASIALQESDPAFVNLGIGVEMDMLCRPLLRLGRAPRV